MTGLDKKYGAILCDPPWSFKTFSDKGKGRSAERHYDCMSFHDLCRIKIPAADDCMLFLWVTDPMLQKAFHLLGEWGFTYKTVGFTWTKRNKNGTPFVGMGYYTRSNPEQCLLATRGSPRRNDKGVRQWIDDKRREHSRKPDEIYNRIERLVDGPYLEMFARQRRPGWDAWGNETEKFEASK